MSSAGQQLLDAFVSLGIRQFCGVPDSILADFSFALDSSASDVKHNICANEGSAIAFGMGVFLANSGPCVVYLQNSGLGNAINPLISMASGRVAHIPMILVIGWRGEPGVKDEPQHIHQGDILLPLLDLLDIPYHHISSEEQIDSSVENAVNYARQNRKPSAIIVSRSLMPKMKPVLAPQQAFVRRTVIETIINSAPDNTVFISTTGYASRELYEVLTERGKNCDNAFMLVGAMGHASQVALAIAMNSPDTHVVSFDGDGSALMHLGSLSMVGEHPHLRYTHILLNNQCHESVGGQRLVSSKVHYCDLANALGYPSVFSVDTHTDLLSQVQNIFKDTPVFLHARVTPGIKSSLTRPKINPQDNVTSFQHYLANNVDNRYE